MSKVSVNAKILNWAIERKGLSVVELSKKFPKLTEWIAQTASPTIKQLEDLSKATSTPLGYFFLVEPPDLQLPIPHFRTKSDSKPKKPSPDLIETVQVMEQRQDWVKQYLIRKNEDQLNFVNSISNNDEPIYAASIIRQALGLEKNWASNYTNWTDALRGLRNSMEEIGILVIINGVVGNNNNRQLDPSEFRGFVLCDNYAPLVFINGSDSKAAQMFTLAHELAHIFLGKSASFDLKDLIASDDPSEQLCNQIAAEILVPEDLFSVHWSLHKNNKNPFQNLAKVFKVSPIVIARRAMDLGKIKKSDFFNFYNEYLQELEKLGNIKKTSGGDFYANQTLRVGRKLSEYVISAVKEGSLLYTDAYRLTGLNGSSFEKFAQLRGLKKTGSD